MEKNQQDVNFTAIVKRLEFIKSLISLEEIEEIDSQVTKMKRFKTVEELKPIIVLLTDKAYSKAVYFIEDFINKYKQVIVSQNTELDSLKLETKVLEAHYNLLLLEHTQAEKLMQDFYARYHKELGELMIALLKCDPAQSKINQQQWKDEQQFNNFYKKPAVAEAGIIKKLSEPELKQLKKTYRNASKLCHPDVVSDDQKELADQLFIELKLAYEKNDLARVEEIAVTLQNGNLLTNKSGSIREAHLLKMRLDDLRFRVVGLEKKLQEIKQSERYIAIAKIGSWDEYFAITKKKLQLQLLNSGGGNISYGDIMDDDIKVA